MRLKHCVASPDAWQDDHDILSRRCSKRANSIDVINGGSSTRMEPMRARQRRWMLSSEKAMHFPQTSRRNRDRHQYRSRTSRSFGTFERSRQPSALLSKISLLWLRSCVSTTHVRELAENRGPAVITYGRSQADVSLPASILAMRLAIHVIIRDRETAPRPA